MRNTRILAAFAVLSACGPTKSAPGDGTGSSSTTSFATTSGAQEPCDSSGPMLDGTTGESFDDAFTFTMPLPPALCNESGTYVAAAWPVCRFTQDCLGPEDDGVYYGQEFACDDLDGTPVSVTVHAPGWYMPGIMVNRVFPRGVGGTINNTIYHCYGNGNPMPIPFEVTEDDYNDVTEMVMPDPPDDTSFDDTNCRNFCVGLGSCNPT